MIVDLYIDGIPHRIDSMDPVTLGRWMLEIFGRAANPTPATMIEVRANASWIQDPAAPGGHRPDWITDGSFTRTERVTSPRDMLAALGKQLDAYEATMEVHHE
jgi:hypothetical protein